MRYKDLWKGGNKTPTAKDDLDLILGSVKNLPLPYWRERFFFKGMADPALAVSTDGRFPATPKKQGSHPVFAIKPVLSGAGFVVCPCSTQYQFKQVRWIEKGTRLRHTNRTMDRRSFLITHIRFNMPESVAFHLTFQGEIPRNAIRPDPTIE